MLGLHLLHIYSQHKCKLAFIIASYIYIGLSDPTAVVTVYVHICLIFQLRDAFSGYSVLAAFVAITGMQIVVLSVCTLCTCDM